MRNGRAGPLPGDPVINKHLIRHAAAIVACEPEYIQLVDGINGRTDPVDMSIAQVAFQPAVKLLGPNWHNLRPAPNHIEPVIRQKEHKVLVRGNRAFRTASKKVGDLVKAEDRGRAFKAHAIDGALKENQPILTPHKTHNRPAFGEVLHIAQGRGARYPISNVANGRPANAVVLRCRLGKNTELSNRAGKVCLRRRPTKCCKVAGYPKLEYLWDVSAVARNDVIAKLRKGPPCICRRRINSP